MELSDPVRYRQVWSDAPGHLAPGYDAVMLVERDGSVVIAWEADGFSSIRVRARFRQPDELASWARGIADEALLERTLQGLHARLRERYPGAFDLGTRRPAGEAGSVIITFHPPKGTPRPEV